jgi:hypothetical protein
MLWFGSPHPDYTVKVYSNQTLEVKDDTNSTSIINMDGSSPSGFKAAGSFTKSTYCGMSCTNGGNTGGDGGNTGGDGGNTGGDGGNTGGDGGNTGGDGGNTGGDGGNTGDGGLDSGGDSLDGGDPVTTEEQVSSGFDENAPVKSFADIFTYAKTFDEFMTLFGKNWWTIFVWFHFW